MEFHSGPGRWGRGVVTQAGFSYWNVLLTADYADLKTDQYFTNSNFKRTLRSALLKNVPNCGLAMLFWTSRGFQWFVMLKTVKPARPLYSLPRKRIFSAFITCRSSVNSRGKRPPALRGPMKSWFSSTIENGKPLRQSTTGVSTILNGAAKSPQKSKRCGASKGWRPYSSGRMTAC